MSILKKIATVQKASENTVTKVEMTKLEVAQCKAAIREKNRGFNVHPNIFDRANPYRVAINYENKWHNYGNFSSADVAAAVGTIVSAAFFGEKAKGGGVYDEAVVETHPEFLAWLEDARNADVIAKAQGETPAVNDGGALVDAALEAAKDVADWDEEKNPF